MRLYSSPLHHFLCITIKDVIVHEEAASLFDEVVMIDLTRVVGNVFATRDGHPAAQPPPLPPREENLTGNKGRKVPWRGIARRRKRFRGKNSTLESTKVVDGDKS